MSKWAIRRKAGRGVISIDRRAGIARGILKPERVRTVSPDLIASVPTSMFLDFMGVRFDPERDDLKVKINLDFTDTDEQFVLSLENSVLNNIPGKQDPEANASLKLTRALFNRVALGRQILPRKLCWAM